VELVAQQEDFKRARLRNMAMLKTGFDLGTQGELPAEREDLHER
jgi:hypothetical protein